MKHKAVSKSDNVWKHWPDKMWRKTAIKQVAKLLPSGVISESLFNSLREEDPEPVDMSGGVQDRAEKYERVVSGDNPDWESDIPKGTF